MKYCECYLNGVSCTEYCRCINCHNTKDGLAQDCNRHKEYVPKAEKGERKKKKNKNGSSEKSHLGKRDLESFGYEPINIKEDLGYTKLGAYRLTDCNEAIFQSEDSNNAVYEVYEKKSIEKMDRYTTSYLNSKTDDQKMASLKNTLLRSANLGFNPVAGTSHHNTRSNDLAKLLGNKNDILMS